MTKFPQMRRRMKISGIMVPMLFYGCFLAVALGYAWLALPLGVVAFILGFAFPYNLKEPTPQDAGGILKRGFRALLDNVVWVMVYAWLYRQPECLAFIQRMFERGALWDWWLLVPLGAWTLYRVIENVMGVAKISDLRIFQWGTTRSEAR